MKEISDIIHAYAEAAAAGKATALATVVQVEGSSYRRPGARMLVTEDGMLTGAISGGCLEGDALRKALLAINDNKNKLITYDTTDEDDAKFGVQLGCNGIVHILFEPISAAQENNPIALLTKAIAERKSNVLVTCFSTAQKEVQPGTCLLLSYNNESLKTHHEGPDFDLNDFLLHAASQSLRDAASQITQYSADGIQFTAFIELIQPPVAINICGAGNDALPLASMAQLMGWKTTIIDGRQTHATTQRFPKADEIIVAKAATALTGIEIDDKTVFVLMTHNYNYDLEILRQLLCTPCNYIGILGPKKKLNRMFDELAEEGITINPDQLSRIYSPVGLDLGAETAEEIALSIAAEIKAVTAVKSAGSLREKAAFVHDRKELPEL